jgi:hypothetical protein
VVKKTGFVAMLDVLGFSERVSHDIESRGGLDEYIDTVTRVTDQRPGLSTVLFSDTVVLFTFSDSEDAFRQIATTTSQLLYELVAREVPVRGAIAHGAFARSEHDGSGTVVAGRPIIEAHHFESQLQWIGVMLAPSVLRRLPTMSEMTRVTARTDGEDQMAYLARSIRACQVQACDRIPVSGIGGGTAGNQEGFAVVPIASDVSDIASIRGSLQKTREKLRWLKQVAPDPRSQAKYQNSISWFDDLLGTWATVLR